MAFFAHARGKRCLARKRQATLLVREAVGERAQQIDGEDVLTPERAARVGHHRREKVDGTFLVTAAARARRFGADRLGVREILCLFSFRVDRFSLFLVS